MNQAYMKYMANPKAFTVKKWISDVLKEKFAPHEPIVDRVGASIITDKDLQDLGNLISAIYETGYLKAVNDYKEHFEKMGIKLNIVSDSKN